MATALSGDTGLNYANHAGDYGIAPGSNHKRLDLDAFAVGRRWRDIGRRTTTSHGLGSDSSNSRANNKARNAGLVLHVSSINEPGTFRPLSPDCGARLRNLRLDFKIAEIGRASCRERVWQYE